MYSGTSARRHGERVAVRHTFVVGDGGETEMVLGDDRVFAGHDQIATEQDALAVRGRVAVDARDHGFLDHRQCFGDPRRALFVTPSARSALVRVHPIQALLVVVAGAGGPIELAVFAAGDDDDPHGIIPAQRLECDRDRSVHVDVALVIGTLALRPLERFDLDRRDCLVVLDVDRGEGHDFAPTVFKSYASGAVS
jgi:hypothetical protein